MTPPVQIAVRLAVFGVASVIIQIAAISQVTVLSVPPDVAPLVVASVGLLCGSIPGAVMGFAMGLMVDTALLQTLGVNSLIYLSIGYGAGRLRELRDPAHALVPLAVGTVAAFISATGFATIQFLLGVDAPLSWILVRDTVVTVVLGALLAMPVHAIARRLLQPLLPDDPRRRRRRAYPTGGLSPLSRA
jgi:rod shape-determining protein MreD